MLHSTQMILFKYAINRFRFSQHNRVKGNYGNSRSVSPIIELVPIPRKSVPVERSKWESFVNLRKRKLSFAGRSNARQISTKTVYIITIILQSRRYCVPWIFMATPIPANGSKKLLNKLPILNLRISRHEEAAVRNERRNLFSAGPGQGEKKTSGDGTCGTRAWIG